MARRITPKERKARCQKQSPKKLTSNQITMLRRRGLDPKNYALLKSTYSSLYLRDLRDGSLKIIQKMN